MKKSILLVFALLILVISFAQTVNFNQVVYNGVDGKYIQVQLSNRPDSYVKAVPVLRNEFYGSVIINGQYFNIAFGEDSDNNYELYVDTDQNGYFDKFNKIPLNSIQNIMSSLPVTLQLKYKDKTYPYIVKFHIFLNSKNPQIYYSCAFWKVGQIKIGSNTYDVELFNVDSNGRFDDLQNDVIGINTQEGASFGRFYTLKFTNQIQLGDYIYVVRSINPQGTQLNIEKSEKAKNKFYLNVGDKIGDLQFSLLTDSATTSTSLSKLSKKYTLIFTWYMDNNSSMKNLFVSNMESLVKKFSNKVNFIGVDVDYPYKKGSDLYKNMNLRFYLQQNGLTFKQMDYKDGIKIMQALNMNFPGEIMLLSKDGTIIYKSFPVWTLTYTLNNFTIDCNQLQSLLAALLQ